MEKFFDQRVAVAPYRATALQGWARVWGAPAAALPSLVALMRADLAPHAPLTHGPHAPAWHLHWALRIPPAAPQIVPAGQPAVLLAKHKILFFVSKHCTSLILSKQARKYANMEFGDWGNAFSLSLMALLRVGLVLHARTSTVSVRERSERSWISK